MSKGKPEMQISVIVKYGQRADVFEMKVDQASSFLDNDALIIKALASAIAQKSLEYGCFVAEERNHV